MFKVTPHPNRVVIKITREQKRKIFEKDIITDDGRKISLVTSTEYEKGCADCGLQTVQYAEVYAVGKNVENMRPGDLVLIDYKVELDEGQKVHQDEEAFYFSVQGKTTYHEKDFKVGHQYVWRGGEIDHVSMVVAIYRDGEVIANDPFVILQYEPVQKGMLVTPAGIMYNPEATPTLVRTVLSNSDKQGIRAGSRVLVFDADMFERSIDDKVFSVIYNNEIIGLIS